MTSFYSWRLIFMTFHGKFRGDHHTLDHAHESPWVMRAPLVLLSVGAVFAGAVFYQYFMKPLLRVIYTRRRKHLMRLMQVMAARGRAVYSDGYLLRFTVIHSGSCYCRSLCQ